MMKGPGDDLTPTFIIEPLLRILGRVLYRITDFEQNEL